LPSDEHVAVVPYQFFLSFPTRYTNASPHLTKDTLFDARYLVLVYLYPLSPILLHPSVISLFHPHSFFFFSELFKPEGNILMGISFLEESSISTCLSLLPRSLLPAIVELVWSRGETRLILNLSMCHGYRGRLRLNNWCAFPVFLQRRPILPIRL